MCSCNRGSTTPPPNVNQFVPRAPNGNFQAQRFAAPQPAARYGSIRHLPPVTKSSLSMPTQMLGYVNRR